MADRKVRRPRQKPEAWRAVMTRFGTSGMSVVEFCRRESLCKASFYRWRALLGQVAEMELPGKTVPEPPDFVDLGMLTQAPTAKAAAKPLGRLELTLDLGGGLVLHLVRG
jgi:hypothetical protein